MKQRRHAAAARVRPFTVRFHLQPIVVVSRLLLRYVDMHYSDAKKTTILNTWFSHRRQIRMFRPNRIEFIKKEKKNDSKCPSLIPCLIYYRNERNMSRRYCYMISYVQEFGVRSVQLIDEIRHHHNA